MSKRIRAAVVGVVLAVSVQMSAGSNAAAFTDVAEGAWYYSAVTELSERGIIDGFPDGGFRPDEALTAAQFLKILCESSGKSTSVAEDWQEGYYEEAVKQGLLIEGELRDGGPDAILSRFDAALLITRFLEKILDEELGSEEVKARITDEEQIPEEYLESVYAAYSAGIIGGYADGEFKGTEGLTRAQAAAIVQRLLNADKRVEPAATANDEPVTDEWFADAAFIGDSLTHGLSLFSGLKTPDYFYSTGVSVYRVDSVSFETPGSGKTGIRDALSSKSYAKIYILLGINELGSNAESYKAAYAGVVDLVREYQPGAVIYLQSVLPVSASKDASSSFTKKGVLRFNEAIKGVAEEKGVRYVDVYTALADENGFLPEYATWDGIHLNTSYYEKWVEHLKSST